MIQNEYFDWYSRICQAGPKDIEKIRNCLQEAHPTVLFPQWHNSYGMGFCLHFIFREPLVKIFSWAITDPKAIKEIVKVSKKTGIVEIGAGSGYWANMLQEHGVDVVAYDRQSSKWMFEKYYFPVEKSDEKAVDKHGDRALFLCWPPYDDDMAYNCISQYKGDTLIYVGEANGGCNANDKFFNFVDSNYRLDNIIYMEQWDGIHDNLHIYKR